MLASMSRRSQQTRIGVAAAHDLSHDQLSLSAIAALHLQLALQPATLVLARTGVDGGHSSRHWGDKKKNFE